MLFGAHRWNHGHFIREALSGRMKVVLARCGGDHGSIGSLLRSLVHDVIEVEKPDDLGYLATLGAALTHRYGTGWCAIGLDDYVCRPAALLDGSGYRCFPTSAADITRQKHCLRAIWNAYCLRNKDAPLHAVPFEYREYDSFNEQRTLTHVVGDDTPFIGSCIVKPDDLSGSIEIMRAPTPDEIDHQVTACLARLGALWRPAAMHYGIHVLPRIQIEAEIPRLPLHRHEDAEFSVEVISEGGRHHVLTITQKWISEDYVELGHVVPATSFPEALKDHLHGAISGLLDELEVSYALSHWEFIVTTDRRLALVEAQLRPAGDAIMDLVELAYGVSAEGTFIRSIAGRDFVFPKEHKCAAAICYLKPSVSIDSYCGFEVAGLDLGSDLDIAEDELRAFLQLSEWSGPTTATDRFVSVIRTGPSLEAARAECVRAARSIALRTDHGRVNMELAL